MGVLFQVEVNNVPDDALEYIVARYDNVTQSLWFWGSWESEAQAREIAKFMDGIVVRRTVNEGV